MVENEEQNLLELKSRRAEMRQSVWERLVIEQLRDIELKRDAFQMALEHIRRLRDDAKTLKGVVHDTTPCEGGHLNKEEERRLNSLALREELELNARILRRDINTFNAAWKQLNENEQIVLTYFFINRPKNHIDFLMEKLNYERSKIYYLKDDALYKLTMLLYASR